VLGSHIYERGRTLRRHSFDHHACNKGKIKRERSAEKLMRPTKGLFPLGCCDHTAL
jgi:hypothetical protein